ncbi:FUN14 family-domain-containing protein [Abortiporus biennis]|nr:FUN14 family-domain-containing protein [Abortiporus biennis]
MRTAPATVAALGSGTSTFYWTALTRPGAGMAANGECCRSHTRDWRRSIRGGYDDVGLGEWAHDALPGTKPSSDGSQSGATPQQRRPGEPEPLPPTPASSVSLYELSFGTVCGICAGVFVKKGAKTLAFVFGGVFVLLQYLGSLTLVKVDWPRVGKKFENLFYTTDVQGVRRAPNVGSLFRWFVDFLTADFQQRASFVAGFALGLRIG